MNWFTSPGDFPSTRTRPEAAGINPRIICSRLVLPDPFDPMMATMPPAGTSKLPSDQMSFPPRTTLTSSNDSAESADSGSDGDTKCLCQRGELGDLPCLERGRSRRHRLGHLDHGHPGRLGGGADLLGYRALGLRVVDEHIDLMIRQGTAEGI